ncbi:MAG: cyclopropane-fatty-acyl-phospholipid synthase family protein, partial [Parvularculaceae bacterium]|nr:cyclopropane-fatty-acyl-phospholipid synthase family protein [Parvularculaceae bacterium]
EKWLDPTMTYSSALFPREGAPLAEGQAHKYRALAQAIDLKPGDRVLEIGSGWGGFAEFAAREFGADVTGLTISPAQLDYASQRIQRQGLAERARFRLCDYRDVDGQFDKIASIEMFEAVGREYWPCYFAKVRETLKPGGAAGLQIITIADRLFDHYASGADFIQRYVFPGGMLPSPSILRRQVADAGLDFRPTTTFGLDYARTLKEWRERFAASWRDIQALGFDSRFEKLWRFYLSYCEAGFRAATTDVCQVVAVRPA